MPFTSTNLPGTQNSLAHYNHPSSSESYYLNTAAAAYTAMNAADARRTIVPDQVLYQVSELSILSENGRILQYSLIMLL